MNDRRFFHTLFARLRAVLHCMGDDLPNNRAALLVRVSVMTIVRIASPHVPPTQNKSYANNKSGSGRGRYRTAEYRTWALAFGYDLNAAMRSQKPITGPYTIEITIDRSRRHKLSDIMNREKVVSDILQEHGVIENDNLCESGTVKWGSAQGGIVIEIRSYNPL